MKLNTFNEKFRAFERQRNPELALKQLRDIVPGLTFSARKFEPGYSVFRSVPWADLPIEQEKLSYPPPRFSRLGRCNFSGQQVLYASHHPSNVFAEQKDLSPGRRFAIGEWKIEPEFYATLVGFSREEERIVTKPPHREFASTADRRAHRRLRKLFQNKGDRYYPQTSAIANYLMELVYPEQMGGTATVLSYVSVEHPNDEILAVNYCFPKEFADQHMKLVAAKYVEVTSVSCEEVKFNTLYGANGADEAERIQWMEQKHWPVEPGQTVMAQVVRGQSEGDLQWAFQDLAGNPIEGENIPGAVSFYSDKRDQ